MESQTPDDAIDYVEFSAFDLTRARRLYESVFAWKFESWATIT